MNKIETKAENSKAENVAKGKSEKVPLKALVALIGIYVSAAIIATLLTPQYKAAGLQAFKNPQNVGNSIAYFVAIIVFTAIILLLSKYKGVLKAILYFVVFISCYYTFYPFMGAIGLIPSAIIIALLVKYPNWLVIDVSAFFLSIGVISIFGISLAPIPAIVLMVILAIYDAISVYRTKHMLTLAESVTDINIPMMFIIPTSKEFRTEDLKVKVRRKEGESKEVGKAEEAEEVEERKAVFIGVGDIVIPNILVASAQRFANTPVVFGIKLSAWLALIGGVIGLTVLLTKFADKPQAGLPFLNFPTIAGFFLSFLI